MKKLFAIFSLLLFAGQHGVFAQVDTLAPIRQFLHVCNGYKQLPVQLEVDIRSSANWVSAPSDTARSAAQFVLCEKGSYMSMDGLEQIANDSLLLIVNPTTKRMQLYPNHESVAVRLQQYLGKQVQDSSISRMGAQFSTRQSHQGDTGIIELDSRANLSHTLLPRQQLKVRYDPVSQQPYTVSQIERSLVPVSDSIFRVATTEPEWAGKMVNVHDSSFFLVREQTRLYYFRRIQHIPMTKLPIQISDRITADLTGIYQPAKDFAAYRLTQQAK